MTTYARKYIEGKKYSQDDLIPLILLVIGGSGGRATKKNVEEKIYDLFREELSKDLYHEKVANHTIPRWKHDIAWARERAKKIHGYIKLPKESARGIWELTSEGNRYYKQLVDKLRQLKDEAA